MKTCPHCGTELPDEARFCLNCGTSQEGTAPQMQARVTGPGAAAQAGGVAAGAGGIAVGGDVHGNIYTGSPTTDPEEALRIYRRVLAATLGHLPLRGVDLGASDPRSGRQPLSLAQVYVDLDTKTRVPLERRGTEEDLPSPLPEGRETRPLGTLEATVANRKLVILGDPGSGKSTFLNHLALCLAMAALEPERGWPDRLPGWPEGEADVVPIHVLLRDFARTLPEKVDRPDEPCHLWDFIRSRLEARNLPFAAGPLHRALEEGHAVVLLDGLDEVPTREKRTFVRDAVAAFAARYPHSRFVVTCRTLSYHDPAWQLADFPPFELAPFDEEKIGRFVGAWYDELARLGAVRAEDAEGLARRLREAVRRPDLWRLAPNPLLLTVMALVHTHKGRLPDARALLYEETVDILLWRWEQVKAGGDEAAPRLRQLLQEAGRTDVDLKRVLWRLAFEAHREGGAADDEEGLADIGELRLQKELAKLHLEGSLDWARDVIEAMKLRAGLLLEREPEVFTFPHRTFQEYLAGAYLSTQADFARRAAGLVEEGAFWREVILLAVGRLVYLSGDTDKPLALVGELCPAEEVDGETAWRKAWLAGEVLVEAGLSRVRESALGRDLLERVRHRLARLLEKGRLRPVERAEAGNILALLGDPRFRADAWYLPDEPLLGFVEVPEGPFLMGSDPQRDPMARENEVPQHEVVLPTYYIGRYPVTVAQFRAFVEASGYEPGDPDSLQGVDNHPVVRVTWYEALAYCRWLTETLREWAGTPEPLATLLRVGVDGGPPWAITLPSEAEWEKAARGGLAVPVGPRGPVGATHASPLQENPNPTRRYPWGDGPDPNRANYNDTGIGGTSAAGCFPGGASPYGVEDLSGNVWEWTRSLWGRDWNKPESGYPYDPVDGREDTETDGRRVLRGGSFYYAVRDIRCAFRYRNFPSLRSWNYGFRVVVASPVLHL